MSMGIVSDADFEKELAELNRKPAIEKLSQLPAKIVPINRGRHEGDKAIPPSLRKTIAESYISGEGNLKELEDVYGVSRENVRRYSQGIVTQGKDNPELAEHVSKVRAKIANSAIGKIKLALEQIDEKKFEGAKLKEISGVAKDMSVVAKNMEPSVANSLNVNTVYQIYAPRERKEDAYEVVEAIDET